MKNNRRTANFYEHYPALFHTYFPDVKTESVALLSEAGFSYYQSILQLDALVDKKEMHRIFPILDLQEISIKKLTCLFPENHHFWNLWNERKLEYKEAIGLEKNLLLEFSEEKYTEVADKKSAFGKIAIDALHILSENKDECLYQKLLKSHLHFSEGFQIHDDVEDFQEDFYAKQFNIAVYELFQKFDFEKISDVEILNKVLYLKGVGYQLLQKSIDSFEKAKAILPDTGSGWYKTIDKMQNDVKAFKENACAYIETLKTKIELKKIPQKRNFFAFASLPEPEIKNGLEFIAKDYSENYADLKHFMWLGKSEDFQNEQEHHYTDTFQRAMLNDCLLDISKKFKLKNDDFFTAENAYLLERTNKDEIGAWSYFPTVKEIAADIDDLGQVMQQFIKTNQNNLIEEYCLPATNIAIEERTAENGGIETWIIPKIPKTENQKTQDHFNTTKWGKGPDVEVVANFLFALFLFDERKYSSVIKKGIEYIISEQNADGFWKSRWYYGNFYGTYVCMRLLDCYPTEYLEIKQKAVSFLQNSQNKNGSFGNENETILSSAFARMVFNSHQTKYKQELAKSKNFLLSVQNENGSWKAENFIKPKANEPYKSKTLSTSFVLKSLL